MDSCCMLLSPSQLLNIPIMFPISLIIEEIAILQRLECLLQSIQCFCFQFLLKHQVVHTNDQQMSDSFCSFAEKFKHNCYRTMRSTCNLIISHFRLDDSLKPCPKTLTDVQSYCRISHSPAFSSSVISGAWSSNRGYKMKVNILNSFICIYFKQYVSLCI